ncbi:hypothetical protein MPQ_1830 [Methylovorus sp. MP688]|nr:hypothetical protein MPQ_1830 [Methylovorus sp. MP688]
MACKDDENTHSPPSIQGLKAITLHACIPYYQSRLDLTQFT